MSLSLHTNIGADYDRIADLMNHTPRAVRSRFQHLEFIAHHRLGWIVRTPTLIQVTGPRVQETVTQEGPSQNNNDNAGNDLANDE